jgi:hypothetical protein
MMKPDDIQYTRHDDSTHNNINNKIVFEENDSIMALNKKIEKPKNNNNTYKKLKEMMNLPFISGIISIVISSIPYVGNYLRNNTSVGYKLIIGKIT